MKLKFTLLCSIFLFSIQMFAQEEFKKNQFGIEIVGYYPFQKITSETWDYLEVENVYILQLSGLLSRNLSPKMDLIFGLGMEYLNSSETDYSPVFPNDIDPSSGIDYYKSWLELSSHNFILITSGELKFRGSSKPSHYYLKTGLESRLLIGDIATLDWKGDFGFIGNIDVAYRKRVSRFKLAVMLSLGRHFDFGKFNFFAEARGTYLPGELFVDPYGTNLRIIPVGLVTGFSF